MQLTDSSFIQQITFFHSVGMTQNKNVKYKIKSNSAATCQGIAVIQGLNSHTLRVPG